MLAVEHTPVKVLDLGLTDGGHRETRLQSHDRHHVAHEPSRPAPGPFNRNMLLPADCSGSNEVVRSKYFVSPLAPSLGSGSTKVVSGSSVSTGLEVLSDLKTFHQQEEAALSRVALQGKAVPDWMQHGATPTNIALPVSNMGMSF